MPETKINVFICCAKQDSEIGERLYEDLKESDIRPWMESIDLLPGKNVKTAIPIAMKQCQYVLALLSENSLTEKGLAQRELKKALDISDDLSQSDIFIIPVRINECEPMDERLSSLKPADLFSDYQNGFNHILEALKLPLRQVETKELVKTVLPPKQEKKPKPIILAVAVLFLIFILCYYFFYPQNRQTKAALASAKALLDIDKYKEARQEYEKILKSDPTNKNALLGLEKVSLYELLATPQIDTGVIEQHLKSFKNQNPDDPHVHVLLGNLYAISGKYKESETYYQTAVKRQDSTASAWFGLGVVYHKQNRLAESVKMYKKAVSLSGSNVKYLNNLAYLYSETRKYPKSIETYRQILKLEPRLLNPYFEITDILRLTGNLEDALKIQETLIKLFEDSQAVNMPYNQEIWYFKTENDEIVQISEMLEKQLLAYYKMVLTLYLSGKENKAEQYLEAIRGVQGDKHNVQIILNHHLNKLAENQPLLRDAIEKFTTRL
ncbi:MAG: TIR domain-containing protein [Desulfobacteraceae bacterium]|nr:TIR domain-containing protein [Desulfobacteraceae bacterium]